MATAYSSRGATAIGTTAATYNISGSNDQLQITIDGGSPQTFTLPHGATVAVSSIVTALAALTSATADVAALPAGSYLRITGTSQLSGSSSIVFSDPANSARSTLGFVLTTPYIGHPIVNPASTHGSFTGATKQNIIDGIELALLDAGWTTISGHTTTNLLMQSQVTPENLQMRIRIKDNGNTCTVLSIENVAGTKVSSNGTGNGGQLNPGVAKTFKVIANQFQVFVFTAASSAGREFVCFGVIHLPAFLVSTITEGFWLQGNAISDTDATANRPSFRTGLGSSNNKTNSNLIPNFQICLNGNLWEEGNTNSASQPGMLSINVQGWFGGAAVGGMTFTGFYWHNGDSQVYDAILCWGLSAVTDQGRMRGQMWDAIVDSDAFTADQTTTYDSRTYWVITDNNTGSNAAPQGSLMVVTV